MEEFYGAHAPCFNVWRLHALIAAICVVTVVRIAATHPVFSPTYDEPLHAQRLECANASSRSSSRK